MKRIEEFLSKHELFPVIPMLNSSKTPMVTWKNIENRIFDIDKLYQCRKLDKFTWIDNEGNTKHGNISGYALLTGEISNTLVIDLDNKNDKNGEQNFYTLTDNLGIDREDLKTLEVITPTGGKHLYFKYSEGLKSTSDVLEGVDIRSNGGLIILPGTHVGTKYYKPLNDTTILDIPRELLNALKERMKSQNICDGEENYFDTGLLLKNVKQGGRDTHLTRCCGYVLAKNPRMSKEELLIFARGLNAGYEPKLTNEELTNKVDHYYNDFVKGEVHFDWYDDKGKIIYIQLAEFLKEKHDFIYHKEHFFKYSEGYYKKMADEEFPTLINPYIKDKDKKISTYNELKAQLKHLLKVEDIKFERNVVNAKNGLIYIDKDGIELQKHKKSYLGINQINSNYNPKLTLDDAPFFKNTLIKMSNNDPDIIKLMQEIGGSSLVPTSHLKKIFIMKGDTDTLKSGLINGIQAVIGEGYYSVIDPLALKDSNNFLTSELYGKTFNTFGEVTTKSIEDSSVLKTLTGDDRITGNVKNKKPIVFKNTATHLYACNGEVRFNNDGGAMTNRLVIIPCKYRLSDNEKIEGYYDNFYNEREAIFNWFLEGLQRLINNNWKFTIPESTLVEKEEFDRNTNDLKYWLKDNIESGGDDDRIIVSNLLNNYEKYVSIELGCKKAESLTLKSFKNNLKREGYKVDRVTKTKGLCEEYGINFNLATRNIDIIKGFKIKKY